MFGNSEKKYETIIAEQTWLEGKIIAQGDTYIGGVISGNIQAKNIQLGQSGKINAHIEAENIIIAGEVHGTVKVKEKLEIAQTGKMIGDIETKVLSMASGAVLNGQCTMARKVQESVNITEKFSLKETIPDKKKSSFFVNAREKPNY